MDGADTARVYAFCCTTWRQRPSDAELAAWKLVLADTDAETGMAAAVALARTGREFMPAPGQLVAQSAQPDHVIAVGEARFLPGTGWVGGRTPDQGAARALAAAGEPAEADAAVRSIRSARSALRRDQDGE